MEQLTLVIDNNSLDRYYDYYFKEHPRSSKRYISKPRHPSINAWMIMQRPKMNAIKGKWKDFIVWFIENEGLTNLQISNCDMTFTTYFETKRRHDVDNTVPKFILDGFAESGLIVDDDEKHLKSLTLKCDYDKNNPRTEILININKKEVE